MAADFYDANASDRRLVHYMVWTLGIAIRGLVVRTVCNGDRRLAQIQRLIDGRHYYRIRDWWNLQFN